MAGAALPAVDRHGRYVGSDGDRGRRCRDREARCGPPAGIGTSRRCRTSPATTDGAARTRPGPRSRRWPRPWAPRTSRGLQAPGPAGSLGVAATVKHFAGYSQAINGHDRNEALLPLSYLQSMILPSYAGGIDAGARHRHGRLRLDQRRSGDGVALPADRRSCATRCGFKGVVISDYQDVPALQTAYHIAADLAEAIAKAVNAGVDMAMTSSTPISGRPADPAGRATRARSTMQRINEAVGRILTLKFQLGLFDQPCVSDPNTPCVDANAANAAVTAGRDAHAQGRAGVDDPAAQPEQHAAALARPPRSSSPARAPTR